MPRQGYVAMKPIEHVSLVRHALVFTPLFAILLVATWNIYWFTTPMEVNSDETMSNSNAKHEPIPPFSTCTPYDLAKKLNGHEDETNENARETCTLVQINALYRHGTRYPMQSDFKKMQSTLHELQTTYNDTIPSWLRTYSYYYSQKELEHLSTSGAHELQELAQNTRRLAELYKFPKKFSSNAYRFEHTVVVRTKESAEVFASNFFKTTTPYVQYICLPAGNDIPLRFFANCPKYYAWVRNSTNMTIETKKFEQQSNRGGRLVKALRSALHLPSNAEFGWKQLKAIYDSCAYDVALYNHTGEWCSLFSYDDLVLIDFYGDIKKYYECGPGFNISVDIAAPLLADILSSMQEFMYLRGHFRFGHAETLLPLVCLLGLCDSDSPLVAAWSEDQIHSRSYRVTQMSPFAGNLEFHVYHCSSIVDDIRVKLYLNERHVPLPYCNVKTHCTLKELTSHFQSKMEYDFQKECQL